MAGKRGRRMSPIVPVGIPYTEREERSLDCERIERWQQHRPNQALPRGTRPTIVYHAGWITCVGAADDLDGADVLPGLRLRLRTVFDQLAALQAEPE